MATGGSDDVNVVYSRDDNENDNGITTDTVIPAELEPDLHQSGQIDSIQNIIPSRVAGAEPLLVGRCKYVKTRAYNAVRQALDDENRVLVCSSPGSGKTYMALVLQQRYRAKNYDIICPRNIREFCLLDSISATSETFLVIDDIFGRFSANTSEILHCFQVLDDIEDHFRRLQKQDQKNRKMFKVLLTSRTEIFLELKPRLKRYKFLLRPACIININLGENNLLDDEKTRILNRHLEYKHLIMTKEDIDQISGYDYKTFGFPYICEMFVNRWKPSMKPVEFFQKPLEYLDEEISRMFHAGENYNQTIKAAVLLLLVLTDGSFNLAYLTDPNATDDEDPNIYFIKLRQLLRNLPDDVSLPNELNKAAKTMIGTYVSCENDLVRFSHPTIYDAVAYVVGEDNQIYVLSNCSLQFIVERVVYKRNIDVSRGNNTKKRIEIGICYIEQLLKRLITEMRKGNIALTLSHQALLEKDVLECLVRRLRSEAVFEEVIHAREKHSNGLSFLFWACYTGLWRDGFLDVFGNPKFEIDEYLEAYLSACISCNTGAFKELQRLVGSLDGKLSIATLNDIAHGADEKILRCNQKDPVVVSRRHNRNHDHLIHIASANGHVDIVELLIDMGIDINDAGGMGMTPLMYSSYFGYVHLVERLLQRGANTEMKNDDDENCLHLATRGGFKNIVKLLIKSMDLNCRGRFDRTPLMYAAYDGHKTIVELFIQHGVDLQPDQTKINRNNSLHEACLNDRQDIVKLLLKADMSIEMRGEKGRTPLLAACRGGRLNTVKLLMSMKAEKEATDDKGNNCVHLAAMSGDIDTVVWLLDDETFDIESRDAQGQTPLICCVLGGHLKLFEVLVERGANVHVQVKPRQTCMHFASLSGNLSIVQILEKKGLEIDRQGFRKRTPVMIACHFGNEDVFTYLASKGVSLTSEDDNHSNCLHLACAGKNINIVQSLLDQKMFDINMPDNNWNTPLQNAVLADSPDIIDLLVKYGAQVGSTMLHLAAKHGSGHAIEKLLQLGLQVDIRNKRQMTPLMVACRKGNLKVVKELLTIKRSQIHDKDDKGFTLLHFAACSDNTKLLTFLLCNGANIQEQCIRGYYPLHSAANAGAVRSVIFFLEKGIPVDVRDERQKTPLMAAMGQSADTTDVVKVLIKWGADLHVVSTLGNSLLHAAAEFGAHTNAIKEIMKYVRLDINAKNDDGHTPIMFSARSGKIHMFRYLLEKGANLATTNTNGETILHLVCKCERIHKDIVKELLKHGLNPAATDDQGKTPEMNITDESQRQEIVDMFRGKAPSDRRRGDSRSKPRYRQKVSYRR